jgi:hypothetical protein
VLEYAPHYDGHITSPSLAALSLTRISTPLGR